MLRKSVDPAGEEVLHVGFDLFGRIYELVGPATAVAEANEVPAWGAAECPSAHLLAQPLSFYAQSAAKVDDDWDGAVPLMVVGIGITHHDPLPDDQKQAEAVAQEEGKSEYGTLQNLYDHLATFSGAVVEGHTEDDGLCQFTDLSWASMPGLAVRYVANRAAPTGTSSLEDLDR